MNIRKADTLICMAALMAGALWAAPIDTKQYFAYYKLPGGRSPASRGPMETYLFLKHEPCQAKGIHESLHAKEALSYLTAADYSQRACWAEIGNTIQVCLVLSDNTVGGACTDVPKSNFVDTKTLPQSPGW